MSERALISAVYLQVERTLGTLPRILHLLFAARSLAGNLDTGQLPSDLAALQAQLPELLQEAAAWQPHSQSQPPPAAARPRSQPVSPAGSSEADMDMDIDAEPPPALPPPLPADQPDQLSALLASASATPPPGDAAAAPLPGTAAAVSAPAALFEVAAQPASLAEPPKRPRTVLEARPVYANPQPAAQPLSPPVRPAPAAAVMECSTRRGPHTHRLVSVTWDTVALAAHSTLASCFAAAPRLHAAALPGVLPSGSGSEAQQPYPAWQRFCTD